MNWITKKLSHLSQKIKIVLKKRLQKKKLLIVIGRPVVKDQS